MLVVDDVAANLLAIETQLRGLGCEIQGAASGEAALSLMMLREPFAAMLLDVLRQSHRLHSTYDQTFSSQRSALLEVRGLP